MLALGQLCLTLTQLFSPWGLPMALSTDALPGSSTSDMSQLPSHQILLILPQHTSFLTGITLIQASPHLGSQAMITIVL